MMLADSDDAVNRQQPKDEAPPNGYVFLLRVNLHYAHVVRDLGGFRDCSKHLLDGSLR